MSTDLPPLGSRCLEMDGLGNRCMKAASHGTSLDRGDRVHDASRGVLRRRWP